MASRENSVQRPWKALVIDRNSFLEVLFVDDDGFDRIERLRRHRSEPDLAKVWHYMAGFSRARIMVDQRLKSLCGEAPIVGDQRFEKLGGEVCIVAERVDAAETLNLTTLPHDDPLQHDAAYDDDSSYSFSSSDSGRVHACSYERRKGKRRPCKRLRYRNFMVRMKQQIDRDPEGFDFHVLELPASVQEGSAFRRETLTKLRFYQAHVLRERRMVHASNASTSASSSSSVAWRPPPMSASRTRWRTGDPGK